MISNEIVKFPFVIFDAVKKSQMKIENEWK